jgi:transposase
LAKVVYAEGSPSPEEETLREKKPAEGGGNGKRKRWSSAEKMRIVLLGMEPGVEVSDVCRREGLNPTMYYQWKRTLLGAAERIFEKRTTKPTAREQRLAQALARAKDVIVEITTENLELKKTFSD